MLSNRSTTHHSTSNNHHRRQWSEGVVSHDKASRFYKDDDRQLIQHLINEYLLHGSMDVFDLIRNCSNECFEALVDVIWQGTSQSLDNNEDELFIYNQRSSLLSSSMTNAHREGARRRLAILLIEVFKLLATQTTHGGRFDIQRQARLLFFPPSVRQLINYEPDIHGLSCLALASMILINPFVIHHQLQLVFDALKYAANQFVKADLSFDTPSTFAVSIYSLFYLLYILYPNNLRRELQPDGQPTITSNERSHNRLGVEKVLSPLFYYFKLHPSIVCGSADIERQENRWQTEYWQHLIASGDRYVVSDDAHSLLSNDFKRRKEEDQRHASGSNRFDLDHVLHMCNDYAESVLHLRENESQIGNDSTKKVYVKTTSADCYSSYSDACCQTYEQQWQTTIQNGQINLSRAQTADESDRRQTSQINGTTPRRDASALSSDHNIYAKVQLQLDMLDCNYEQDKREHYAQLIRDAKKTIPIHDVDKELRNQEIRYEEMLSVREQRCPEIHALRDRIGEFHQLNEAFYNALSATQVELKTDEDNHWQQRTSLTDKHSKLTNEVQELEQAKAALENELRETQRRLFQSKKDVQHSIEVRDSIQKLSIELSCARKKHQLLHNALVQIKLKPTNAEKLFVVHRHEEEEDQEQLITTVEEKRKKFDDFKQLLEKQHADLTSKRNNFQQLRNMNTHKINIIRRQIDSTRICQTQLLLTMNTNSQIVDH